MNPNEMMDSSCPETTRTSFQHQPLEGTSNDLTLSVIVPVYNGGVNFYHCLNSLRAVRPKVLDIIVVDDGSTDDSGMLAEQIGAKVFKFASPGGPARARNQGAHIAQGSILFFIDADVTLTEETIDRVLETFRECPSLAALIGSYDDEPGAKNFLSQYKNLFHHYTHQTACEDASTFWGACGAIRREAFWAVGGFDERYRYPSIEDIELGYRLKRAGYLIHLNKTVQVKHLKHWKIGSLLRAEIFYRAVPWTELLWQDQQFNNDLNLKHSSRVSLVLTYAFLSGLLMGWWWFPAWIISIGIGLLLLILNWPVYKFFYQKRGLLFATQAIFWHWLYFLYGGFAFVLGTCRYVIRHHQKAQLKNMSS